MDKKKKNCCAFAALKETDESSPLSALALENLLEFNRIMDLFDAMAAVYPAREMRQQRQYDMLERAALVKEREDEQRCQRRQRRMAKAPAEEESFEKELDDTVRATAILAVCEGLKFPLTKKLLRKPILGFVLRKYVRSLAQTISRNDKRMFLAYWKN